MPLQITGANGLVGGRNTLSSWAINLLMTTNRKAYSNTKGGMLTRRGPKDWNGSLNCGGVLPQVFPGDTFDGRFFVGPESEYTPGSTGPVYEGTAIVDQVVITIDWKTGAGISYVINFSGTGELTETEGSYEDDSFPDVPSSTDATVMLVGPDGSFGSGSDGSGPGGETELCGIETLTLTLTAANAASVNSCSGGWTTRRPGIIDWTLNLVVDEASLAALPFSQGDYVWLRIYVDETRYWSLKWGMVKEFTNFTVDRESAALINVTVPIEMTSHTEDSELGIGHVQVPSHPGVDWWPKGETGLELLANPSFADGGDHWATHGVGTGNFTGGDFVVSGIKSAYQMVWLEASKTYRASVTVSATDGNTDIIIGASATATSVVVESIAAPGTATGDFTPVTTGWHYFQVTSTNGGDDTTVNSVSLKPYN
jgi:hypothetical protein